VNQRAELIEEFGNRLAEFHWSYDWTEVDALLRAFSCVGDLIEAVFDPVTAARGMTALKLVLNTHPSDQIKWDRLSSDVSLDWKEEWGDLGGFDDSSYPALMDGAHDMHAFAIYGIMTAWNIDDADKSSLPFTDVPAYVKSTVARLEGFARLLPAPLELYGIEELAKTCLAASGRLKIDLEEPLTVHELAAVTGVTPKRLQNAMYAKSADAPIANKNDGLISVASAQRWLEAREYKPSIWKEFIAAKAWEHGELPETVAEVEAETDDFVFVPEARDGSLFTPTACKRGGKRDEPHYTIGAKGSEQDFDSYDEALAELSRMTVPRWRRPNEQGNFGIVTAERWRRLSRAELKSL
jgi:hypothetical protein